MVPPCNEQLYLEYSISLSYNANKEGKTMRLNEMYFLIQRTLDNWVDLKFIENKKGTTLDAYSCDNYKAFVDLIKPLNILPVVAEGISFLSTESKRTFVGGRAYISQNNLSTIQATSNRIKTYLEAMAQLCETMGIKSRADGFDIKLPPNITLEELSKCLKDFDTIFTQCPTLRQEGKVNLENVDIGSIWLVFTVIGGSVIFLKALAELVDKALIIRSHWLTCKEEEERVKTLGLKNDTLESLVGVHSEVLKKIKEDAVNELAQAHSIEDPKEKERLSLSLNLLDSWMQRGVEVYSAIGSAEEVKAVFPPIERQALSEEVIKMITSSSESGKNEDA